MVREVRIKRDLDLDPVREKTDPDQTIFKEGIRPKHSDPDPQPFS